MAKRKRTGRGDHAKRAPRGATAGDARALLGALDLLAERRAPYADLLAEIATDTLDRFPPLDARPLIEIGAGTGQLRSWLPPERRAAMVHTDPSGAALRRLRERAPDARTAIASAAALPFVTGTCGAVLGLCVFDAIPASDHAATVGEIARVLAPGGRFLHLLDMATLLEQPFEKLAASGLVPIPNLFGDPADHEWPLDIVLVKRDWLAGLLAFAARTGHPLAAAFGDTFAAFLDATGGHDTQRATDAFKALAASGAARDALAALLPSASRMAFEAGYPAIAPLPFHSGRYLASVLETAFRQSGAFRVEPSAIVARSAWRPAPPGSDIRYRSLCVGHQRISSQLPSRLLTESARAQSRLRDESTVAPPDEMLVEVGVFVFVATRL